MKVLLLNGSPKVDGCTKRALKEVADTLEKENIEAEIVDVGSKDIRGCIACGSCVKNGKCVFNDIVIDNDIVNVIDNDVSKETNNNIYTVGNPPVEYVGLFDFWNSKPNLIHHKEISKIYLNFSDPWPKKRHEKRRLSSSGFLKKYDEIL